MGVILTFIQFFMETLERLLERFKGFGIFRPVQINQSNNLTCNTVIDVTDVDDVMKSHPLGECRHVEKTLQE